MSNNSGVLYVVATPIGNLEDITLRALRVLGTVDAIFAEDTRHSQRLLRHYAIRKPLHALHDHNERRIARKVRAQLEHGESVALISDAGTPVITDPGYHLVKLLRECGLRVVPIPGPSALVCALSAAGLPTDRFVFEGFLPSKPRARMERLRQLAAETRTLVFYEAPHRVRRSVSDLASSFGPDRPAALARELTKTFETIRTGCLEELQAWLEQDRDHEKGEFVVVVSGAGQNSTESLGTDELQVLRVLLRELPLKQAVRLAARLTGQKRNRLYEQAVDVLRSAGGQGVPEKTA